MSNPCHLLVVDNDPAHLDKVTRILLEDGHRVTGVEDGSAALERFRQSSYDLILLGQELPHVDGLTVCQEIRRASTVPIIIISPTDKATRTAEALDHGADDYITKGICAPELSARVRAILRRASYAVMPQQSSVIEVGDLRLDHDTRSVTVAGREVVLTPTEYRLLSELAHQAGRVIGHEALLRRVWGPESKRNTEYLHIYIGRLRKKLGEMRGAEIVTETGVGYWLRPGPDTGPTGHTHPHE